jgi:hypothetical protein
MFFINITENKSYQNSVNTRKRKNKRSFKGISKWKKKEKARRTNGLHLIPRYMFIKVSFRIAKDFDTIVHCK